MQFPQICLNNIIFSVLNKTQTAQTLFPFVNTPLFITLHLLFPAAAVFARSYLLQSPFVLGFAHVTVRGNNSTRLERPFNSDVMT